MSGDQVKATYQDEFSLENFEIKLASYIAPWMIPICLPRIGNKWKASSKTGPSNLNTLRLKLQNSSWSNILGLKRSKIPKDLPKLIW